MIRNTDGRYWVLRLEMAYGPCGATPISQIGELNLNRTANGSILGQWGNSASPNQQWTIVAVGAYYKVINRANGKCIYTGGSGTNGAAMQFWTSGSSFNQQWSLELVQ